MVDVSPKAVTRRSATASCRVLLGPQVFGLVQVGWDGSSRQQQQQRGQAAGWARSSRLAGQAASSRQQRGKAAVTVECGIHRGLLRYAESPKGTTGHAACLAVMMQPVTQQYLQPSLYQEQQTTCQHCTSFYR
jgi:hypothetical protein